MSEATEYKFNSREILESLDAGDPYLRRNFIGASDAPIIMGVSPWSTPYQLWQEKCGIKKPFEGSFVTDEGHRKEVFARDLFESKMGEKFPAKRLFSDQYDWMMASLDGYNERIKKALEIKCPGEKSHQTAKLGIVPIFYFPQVQHQMFVANLQSIYYLSYINDESYVILTCERDDKYIDELIKKELHFWKCVQNCTPPELSDRDFVIKNDDEWEELAMHYLTLQNLKTNVLLREESIKSKLIELSNDRNSKGCGVKLQKICKKGNIDYSSIPELEKIDLEQYRKDESHYWKITNMENEE